VARLRHYYSYVVPGKGVRVNEVDIGRDTPLPGDGFKLALAVLVLVVLAVVVAAIATYVV
jgi:hypothetical protein